jgi:hypothetical protein
MNAAVLTGSRGRVGAGDSSYKTCPPQGGRSKLLMFIDSLVHVGNGTDFNSLLSVLELACCETVTVVSCLQSQPSTDNRVSLGVLTSDHRVAAYVTQEPSAHSIALVWMILYCAHPDGVMKVVINVYAIVSPNPRQRMFSKMRRSAPLRVCWRQL